MASADAAAPARVDWALANPWTWAVAGVAATGLALGWVQVFGEELPAVRFVLILAGLLAAGGGVALRLTSGQGSFLDGLTPSRRSAALLAVAAAGAALAVGATALLLGALFGEDIPWKLAGVLRVWLLAAPAGAIMAYSFFRRRATGKPVSVAAESAAILLLAAVTAFLACWALYVDEEHALEWDTIRLFLAVLALVGILGAGLVVLPARPRRLVISAMILLHFGGIATAALSPPPSAWIVTQIYGRVFRPYLEFMYLTNAYHYYAPDPGPSSYLWCRLEYKNAAGQHHWRWVKAPKVDEHGLHHYPSGLAYQRRIAMLDNSRGSDPLPPFILLNPEGRQVMNPIYYWRAVNSTTPPEPDRGRPTPKPTLIVPFHPDTNPWYTQYSPPNITGRFYLSSFARHLGSLKHPDFPEDEFVSVKIYRVVHNVLPITSIALDIEPGHPVTFQPFYQGRYDREGQLLDAPKFNENGVLVKGDPFLYWLVPILPERPGDPTATVYNYVSLHAGDRDHWVRPEGEKEWTDGPPPPYAR
jgi:hypothetical protein